MRSRARGISLSLLALFLVARASHACASPRPDAEASRAGTAAAMTPDKPGTYSESGYDVQVTVETEEIQKPDTMTEPSGREGRPPCLSAKEKTWRYLALGLPEAKLEAFLQSGRSLTTWFNEEHIGGYHLKAGGAFLIALGAVSLIAGAVATGILWHEYYTDQGDDGGVPLILIGYVCIPAMAAGLLELGVGIPMVVVGNRRMRRWAKEGELETVPMEELERRRDQSQAKPKTTVSVLPYLTRGGGGFSLALRF